MTLSFLFNIIQMDSTADFIGKVGFPIASAVGVAVAMFFIIKAQVKQQTKMTDFMMSVVTSKFEKISENFQTLESAVKENTQSTKDLVETLENKIVPINRNSTRRSA